MKRPVRLKKCVALLWIAHAFWGSRAFAGCNWNDDRTFYGCDPVGIVNGIGSGLPSINNLIGVNPGSIPTTPTPVGIEGLLHSKTDSPEQKHYDIAVVRGFSGFGLGMGTASGDALARPSLRRIYDDSQYFVAAQTLERENSDFPGYQIGSSVGIPLPLAGAGRLSAGAAIGKTATSVGLAKAFGVTWSSRHFNAGGSYSFEGISDQLPDIRKIILTAGLQHEELSLTWSRVAIWAAQSQPVTSIYSLRWKGPQWSIFGALRTFVDEIEDSKLVAVASVQRMIGKRVAIGYLFGYYENSHSLSLQLYL